MRRGQTTLFVLLGLVLLTVFSLAIGARSLLVQDKIQAQARTIVEDFLQQNSVTYYVDGCLERVALDAMRTSGLQGGENNIADQDPPQNYLDATIEEEDYRVLYGLVPNEDCESINTEVPYYPWPNTKLEAVTYTCQDSLSGTYGSHRLKKLCANYGQNSYLVTSTEYYCRNQHYGLNEHSIQHSLGQATAANLVECVDFTIYEEFGHNITLDKSNVNVEVLYGKNTITFIAHFPFEVEVQGRRPVLTIQDFTYTAPIRFKKIYEFVSDLLQADAQRYDFSIIEDYESIASFDLGYEVEYVTMNGDNILRVQDLASPIDGVPLSFLTAIKNRRPALDYINDSFPPYHLLAQTGSTLTLYPQGYDPDDEELTYTYSGWKADYDEVFDVTCPLTTEDFTECQTEIELEDSLWDGETKDKSVILTDADIGPHVVRITITDEEGLEDYQDVRVLVFDAPTANVFTDNLFATISNTHASIEDPYYLDGSASEGSIIMGEDIDTYTWTITSPTDESFVYEREEDDLLIPYDLEEEPILPQDITEYLFNEIGGYTISLVVHSGDLVSAPEEITVNVRQCLPYHSTTPIYPYNEGIVPYDHTCCQGSITDGDVVGGTYEPTTRVCFTNEQWGELNTLLGTELLGQPPLPTSQRITYGITIDPDAHQSVQANDVWQRTLERSCSGLRGNICSGSITEHYSIALACADYESGAVERCQGPPLVLSTTAPLACERYTSTTFEEEFGYANSDGICNYEARCSNTQYDDALGEWTRFLAQASCTSGTCNAMIETIDCQDENSDECDPDSYLYVRSDYGCNPTTNTCQPKTQTPLWATRCEQPSMQGSRYCSDEPEPQACGPNECCDPDSILPSPCTDPCQAVSEECRSARDCTGGLCVVHDNSYSCDYSEHDDGYCNPSSAYPTKCEQKRPPGALCTHNNMCQTNHCTNNLCA